MHIPRISTIILLSLFLFAGAAHAETGLNISPPTLELMLAPNKSVIQNITLTGVGQSSEYQVSLHRLIPVGEDGGSTIDLTPIDPSSIPYVITLDNQALPQTSPLSFAPGETKTVTLKINSASTDISSTDALAIGFTPVDSSSFAAQPIIALPLLLTLTPDGILDIDLELLGFELPIVVDSLQSFALAPKLKNNSAFMHRPKGQLSVGETSYTISPELILGDSTRRLRFDTDGRTSPTISFEPDITRFGPHKITLVIETAGDKVIIENTRIVWFLPLRLLAITILVLTTIIGLYLRLRLKKGVTLVYS
jgi:hypothetical protein